MNIAAAKQYEHACALLKKRGIRLTTQRDMVLRQAISYLHFTAEQLVKNVLALDRTISRASVYRTLALLEEIGLVEKHHFRYAPPNYEVTYGKAHHDHLMCIRCGEIIEFQAPEIERQQSEVATRFGYELLAHTYKLYGLCKACQRHPSLSHRRLKPQLHVEQVVA